MPKHAIHRQRGLTTVEYAIAGALISVAVVVGFTQLGEGLKGAMQFIVSFMT